MSNANDAKDTRDSNTAIDHLSCSNLAAQFSEQMAIAAIPILAVLALGASAQASATLQAINTLPFLLLSIPAGLLADRYRRKQLMIATELIRAAALFLLFALFSARTLGLYGLAALGFAIATGTVVYSVAAPALVAALIDKDDLLTANRRPRSRRRVGRMGERHVRLSCRVHPVLGERLVSGAIARRSTLRRFPAQPVAGII